jgi:acyl-CoA thioester hydrolase
MGVAYYANYFVWFEVGRTDLLRTLGWSYREMEDNGIIMPVIDARCEYLQASRYDDELDVRTTGRLLSPIRIQFDYDVVRRADRVTAARGHTIHAAIDMARRPCRLPERIRRAFA